MKQVLQDFSHGKTFIIEAPTPSATKNKLLINTSKTLISPGTERMLVDFGKASYLQKARQQPERVKAVIDKVKTDGLATTIDAVRAKLSEPFPLGYCNVGVIASHSNAISGFKVGDRVVSSAPHADVVSVYPNLCARIPDAVDDETAAFTVISSIALQGIRLAQPTLGEAIVVTGVGLIGLLSVQILVAHGCRVLAVDFDDKKLELAKLYGAEVCNPSHGDDPVKVGMSFSRGRGVDAVIVTASTSSSTPIHEAAQMSRRQGRIILVGSTGLELNRNDFYEKELSFQVSCSYGPGRYDPSYEEQSNDYPIGYVRWTEQRNFEAVLDLMSENKINVKSLISHRFMFEDAVKAYDLLTSDSNVLGILLDYQEKEHKRHTKEVLFEKKEVSCLETKAPVVGFIGAGNYASRVLIPAYKKAGACLHSIVTARGVSASFHGKRAGFKRAVSDVESLLTCQEVNHVVIATKHNLHAQQVIDALKAQKHVFVEKPLALNYEELSQIESAYNSAVLMDKPLALMVGFNRRFSPLTQKMKALLKDIRSPKAIVITVNAGSIPGTHWTQDIKVGGGRIIGEACHFIDLMRHLSGNKIVSLQAQGLHENISSVDVEDNVTITLGFGDGSIGTVHYFANGNSKFPKERVEVFTEGKTLQLDNFLKLTGFGWPGFKQMRLFRQDKGQLDCIKAFLDATKSGLCAPIPFEELVEVTEYTIKASELVQAEAHENE